MFTAGGGFVIKENNNNNINDIASNLTVYYKKSEKEIDGKYKGGHFEDRIAGYSTII